MKAGASGLTSRLPHIHPIRSPPSAAQQPAVVFTNFPRFARAGNGCCGASTRWQHPGNMYPLVTSKPPCNGLATRVVHWRCNRCPSGSGDDLGLASVHLGHTKNLAWPRAPQRRCGVRQQAAQRPSHDSKIAEGIHTRAEALECPFILRGVGVVVRGQLAFCLVGCCSLFCCIKYVLHY